VSLQNTTRQYIIVFAAAAVLYGVSCAPSLLWQDSGMIQYRVLQNDIEGGFGLALSHPLYYIISIAAKYVPVGNVIYRINMVSALAGAFAIANLYLLVKLWKKQTWPAVIAALSLALSHTFWRHASIVETYNLYLAFLFLELIYLCKYRESSKIKNLCFLGLFNGLAISVHMLAVIPLTCYIIYLLILLLSQKIKIRTLMLFILCWVVGAASYEYLVISQLIQTGDVWATLKSAFFGVSYEDQVLNVSLTLKIIKENILFIGMNFPTPNIILIVSGLFVIFRNAKVHKFGLMIIVLTGLFFFFAFRYTVPDRYAFFLPFYSMLSILIGGGTFALIQRYKSKAVFVALIFFSVFPAAVYTYLPGLVEDYYPIFKDKRQLPYRNEYTYFLWPARTGYTGAERFAKEAIENVPDGSLIFADGTSLYPLAITKLLYYPEKDVSILSRHGSYDNLSVYTEEQILEMIKSHPSYVVSQGQYCPEYIRVNFHLAAEGLLFKIETN
jgi:hypothetical protein